MTVLSYDYYDRAVAFGLPDDISLLDKPIQHMPKTELHGFAVLLTPFINTILEQYLGDKNIKYSKEAYFNKYLPCGKRTVATLLNHGVLKSYQASVYGNLLRLRQCVAVIDTTAYALLRLGEYYFDHDSCFRATHSACRYTLAAHPKTFIILLIDEEHSIIGRAFGVIGGRNNTAFLGGNHYGIASSCKVSIALTKHIFCQLAKHLWGVNGYSIVMAPKFYLAGSRGNVYFNGDIYAHGKNENSKIGVRFPFVESERDVNLSLEGYFAGK